jgi:hypothetical protein
MRAAIATGADVVNLFQVCNDACSLSPMGTALLTHRGHPYEKGHTDYHKGPTEQPKPADIVGEDGTKEPYQIPGRGYKTQATTNDYQVW